MRLMAIILTDDHVMFGLSSGRGTTVATVDIVCGTLQAKLHTKDVSSGSSLCVLFDSRLLTPYGEFQRLAAGKASARN